MKRHVVATRQTLLFFFLKNRTQFYVSAVWFVIHIVFSQFVNEGNPLTNTDPLLVPIHPKKKLPEQPTIPVVGYVDSLIQGSDLPNTAPYPTFRKGVMEEKANINIFKSRFFSGEAISVFLGSKRPNARIIHANFAIFRLARSFASPSFPLPSSPKWHQHEQDFVDVLPCPLKLPATLGSSARQSPTVDPLRQLLHISLLAVAACWRPTCDIIVDANCKRSNVLQFCGVVLLRQILKSQTHVIRLKQPFLAPPLNQPGISSMVM